MENKKEFYVYEWFIVDTLEVFHVGKGKGQRMYQTTNNRNKHFQNIVNKYECSVRIYKDNLTETEAWAIEKERISELKSVGQAKTNYHIGGNGGDTWWYKTEDDKKEFKMKISSANKGKKRNKHFKERLKKHLEHNHPKGMLGKKHSDETKQKMSESRKGKKLSEEHKQKLREAQIGKKHPHKKETIEKLSKKILLVDKDNNVVMTIKSAREACRGDWRLKFPKPNSVAHLGDCLKNRKEFHGYYLIPEGEIYNELQGD